MCICSYHTDDSFVLRPLLQWELDFSHINVWLTDQDHCVQDQHWYETAWHSLAMCDSTALGELSSVLYFSNTCFFISIVTSLVWLLPLNWETLWTSHVVILHSSGLNSSNYLFAAVCSIFHIFHLIIINSWFRAPPATRMMTHYTVHF